MSYEKFHDNKMTDYIPTDEEIEKGFAGLPKLVL
jgi:tryptophan synthase beta chain